MSMGGDTVPSSKEKACLSGRSRRLGRHYARARAEARIKLVKEIKRLSCDDWRGWAWLAERMFPGELGRSEPRTILIERLPPAPSPEPETPPKGMERWLTPKGKGIPLDKESLNYLVALRRHLDSSPPTRSGNDDGEAS
jgi:hypothetical protein